MSVTQEITIASIMVVDDDPDVTYTFAHDLSIHGIKAERYSDPAFALAEFKPKYYDMIMIDVNTPGVNGFELAKQIWIKDPEARICFFSANRIYEQQAQIMFGNLKTVDFIEKPILPAKLANYILERLPRSNTRQKPLTYR
jgi:DNA-binding response OmpR family regulator